MTGQNHFMRLPPELCLMVVECLVPDKPKQLQLLCCYECNELEEAEHDNYVELVAGVKDALALSSANRALQNEVKSLISKRVVVNFCLRQNGNYGSRINGLGHSFSAYERISDENTVLGASLRSFRYIKLVVDVDGENGYAGNLKSRPLYHVLNQALPPLDDLRLFVEAVNVSPAVAQLDICVKINGGVRPRRKDVYWALQPLDRLSPDLRLDLHLQKVSAGLVSPIDASTLTATQQDHLERLLYRRASLSTQTMGKSLIDEWMHLRAWLLLTSWDVHTENLGVNHFPDNLTRRLAIWMNTLEDQYDDTKLRDIVVDTWRAHDQGDRQRFCEGKQQLRKWFADYFSDQLDVMMRGFGGMDFIRQDIAREY